MELMETESLSRLYRELPLELQNRISERGLNPPDAEETIEGNGMRCIEDTRKDINLFLGQHPRFFEYRPAAMLYLNDLNREFGEANREH
jgi:hypothetical protein